MNDDIELIEQTRQGDVAAFEKLVRKHQDRLFNTIMHVVGNREEAEDVVQEAFVQAFLKLNHFQRQSAFYTWLYRIAFNTAVSRQRRKRVENSSDRHHRDRYEPPDTREAPEEQLLRAERVRQVQVALAALSDEHRVVIVLREIEGCDYETIAEILAVNVGTVRSRLHRARMQMREQLKRVLQGQPNE